MKYSYNDNAIVNVFRKGDRVKFIGTSDDDGCGFNDRYTGQEVTVLSVPGEAYKNKYMIEFDDRCIYWCYPRHIVPLVEAIDYNGLKNLYEGVGVL